MSYIRESKFTCCEMAQDFQIFCSAPVLECGKVFALPAPSLPTGVVFRVDMVLSREYIFTAASGFCLTVTACFCTAKHAVFFTAKTPKSFRKHRTACHIAAPFRKMTVLRL